MRCPVCFKEHGVGITLPVPGGGSIDVVACEAVPESVGGIFVRPGIPLGLQRSSIENQLKARWGPDVRASVRRTHTMNIGQAIEEMRQGRRVAREGWNGKGMWLALQVPDEHSKMTLPYVFMSTAQGALVPWLCSQTDLLADDWAVLETAKFEEEKAPPDQPSD